MKTLTLCMLCCALCLAAAPLPAEPLGSFESPAELSTPTQIEPEQTDRLLAYRVYTGTGYDLWGLDLLSGQEFRIAGDVMRLALDGSHVVWSGLGSCDGWTGFGFWAMELVLPNPETPSGTVTTQPLLLTATTGGTPYVPFAVSGDLIVWSDRRRSPVWDETAGQYRQVDDIYGRRISTGQEMLIHESAPGRGCSSVATDGRWVAWVSCSNYAGENGDLMVHDVLSGETITVVELIALACDRVNVGGGLVVFHTIQNRPPGVDRGVWVYDLATREIASLSSDPGSHTRSTLDDRTVVWRHDLGGAPMLRSAYLPSGGVLVTQSRPVSPAALAPGALDPDNPSLRAGRLAWDDARDGPRRLWALVRFADVPLRHWAYWHIEQCARAGVVRGYPEGDYRPEEAVTRAQMAVYLSRALLAGAAPPSPPLAPSFTDVDTGFWAYPHIEYCASQDIVQGYPEGDYRPEETVDRAQMAVYVSRSLAGGNDGVPPPPQSPSFTDVDTGFWAYPHIEHCVAQGVVRGYPEGDYRPAETVTRDQMAVYVGRAFLAGR